MKSIAIASGKGGVGKSTVAALLAAAYKAQGLRVALLDVDLYGPSLPTLFGIEHQRHEVSENNKIQPIVVDGIQVASFGCIIGEMPAVMRGPMIARYTTQMLSDIEWDAPDILLLDLPPGTGDIHLTVTQTLSLDGAIVITTPHALSFADVGKAIIMLNKVNVPVLGVVMNMAYYQCGTCQTKTSLFGAAAASTADNPISRRFGIPTLGALPLDPQHFSTRIGTAPVPPAITGIADTILPQLEQYHNRALPVVTNTHEAITIDFADGTPPVSISPPVLRRTCRCALCYDEYTGAPRWSTPPGDDVFAQEIKPIGNYALYIKWSDHHATGFFPLEYIRQMAADPTTSAAAELVKEHQ